MTNQTPVIRINPKRALIFLVVLVAILVGMSIWGQYLRFIGGWDIHSYWQEVVMDFMNTPFYMDAESNIPTFINSLMLFIASLLLAMIAAWKNSVRDKFRFQWIILALIFLLLSIDEVSTLHERLIKPMRAVFGAEGIFYFAWIVPGLVAVGAFLIAYLTFFIHLETRFKLLFFLSLAIYLSGVIGGEMVSGYFASNLGQKNFTYAMVASLEESVEMLGCSFLIYSLLEYLKTYLPGGILVNPA
ncbi:MAG: hypothetical protein IPG44_10720 [Anaerolineales bacterium]|jgi:hypothetical protein|nr:hypothetical protein [Chloroflexota bacterium]MBK6646198.1 hypothetical protein [Anaerolineales bacterium]MCC6985454.1 hypothetical protein [Anaerolineales bacterium]